MRKRDVQRAIRTGQKAAEDAEAFRKATRRRSRPNVTRNAKIDLQLIALRQAMTPIRSLLGRLQYEELDPELERELRAVSASVQYQAHALRRMRR